MNTPHQPPSHSVPDRARLLGIAVARGCTHYRDFADPALISDDPSLPHEFLGCALLQGDATVETFQAIRVGGMVLADRGNQIEKMARFAAELGVSRRLAQLAQVAITAGDAPAFWRAVLDAIGPQPVDEFFPSASRLSLETYSTDSGLSRSLVRHWLRTSYHKNDLWRVCRLRDLPADESAAFREWLRGETAPAIDGAPLNEQDGYYFGDYLRWRSQLPPHD